MDLCVVETRHLFRGPRRYLNRHSGPRTKINLKRPTLKAMLSPLRQPTGIAHAIYRKCISKLCLSLLNFLFQIRQSLSFIFLLNLSAHGKAVPGVSYRS